LDGALLTIDAVMIPLPTTIADTRSAGSATGTVGFQIRVLEPANWVFDCPALAQRCCVKTRCVKKRSPAFVCDDYPYIHLRPLFD
jgi:hypothetical protein